MDKSVQDVLNTLTDEQRKAVAIFCSIVVNEELKKHGIEGDELDDDD